ncbi:MmcQ/YjbR family DNA-binding protein [Treponema socranskii]|uniref:MmcQ/YjbR family DNA-binding protein n=1 Tax=Treponema socranskii TaxID=53419 RepID=UPI0023F49706|nr:MmcQ/YjbR family DNA-binding protein [Treponema socranskii]
MTIEEEIFARSIPDFAKLVKFGFVKNGSKYSFSGKFLNGDFTADVVVTSGGDVTASVFDVQAGERYLPLRAKSRQSAFVNEVRESYRAFLRKIKNACFVPQPFLTDQANRIAREAEKLFGDKIDFPFSTAPTYGVFRNPENRKWYGIIMNIPKSKIENSGRAASLSAEEAIVEVINVKIDPEKSIELKKRRGFYDAYHMSKKNWITIALDGSVSDSLIVDLLKKSRALVSPRPCRARS